MKLKSICIFCGSSVGINSAYREAAIEIGKYFAENNITYVYGGGKIGLMGIIADNVLENGGKAIGVIPSFLSTKEIMHDNLTECYVVETMHDRKRKMYELSDAFIAMPGGFGTLDELFEIITWHQLFLHQKPIVLYNVDHYFDPLLQMISTMRQQNFISNDFGKYFQTGDSLKGIISLLENWSPQLKG